MIRKHRIRPGQRFGWTSSATCSHEGSVIVLERAQAKAGQSQYRAVDTVGEWCLHVRSLTSSLVESCAARSKPALT